MANRNRLITWAIIGALLIAALIFAFRPRPIPVDVATVTKGTMQLTVNEEGKTRVKDVFRVSSPVTGNIDRVTLKPGDPVSAGVTKLAALHPATPPALDQRTESQLRAAVAAARSSVLAAEAEVRSMRHSYNLAVTERDRVKALFTQDFVSQAALDQAVTAANAGRSSLEASEAALSMHKSELQRARFALIPRRHESEGTEHIDLRAVIDGVVLTVLRESEGPIAGGTPIIEIGDPKNLEIMTDLLTEEAVQVSIGDTVEISGWGGDTLYGHVRLIEPFAFTRVSALGIEEQRVNVIIDFDDKPQNSPLGHGYHTDISIIVWQAEDVTMVPLTALIRHGDEWSVFVHENGKAHKRIIDIGVINGQSAQVINGLEADDKVIIHPSGKIADGIRVDNRR